MRVVIFGASGVAGSGVLRECLEAADVEAVRTVGRSSLGIEHTKLSEIAHSDFLDFSAVEDQLGGLDACFWCLGTASAGVSEADYTRITLDFTRAAAETLHRLNPEMAFCFISGAGTSPDSRQMWARVKAQAEQMVLAQGFGYAACFRPGGIRADGGVAPRATSYKIVYGVLGPALPWLQRKMPSQITSARAIGRAMLAATRSRTAGPILECLEINELAGG